MECNAQAMPYIAVNDWLGIEPESPSNPRSWKHRPLPRDKAGLTLCAALCEAYRRSHPGVSIYYDDANIRVYHIRH